jgi:hypothetical protein
MTAIDYAQNAFAENSLGVHYSVHAYASQIHHLRCEKSPRRGQSAKFLSAAVALCVLTTNG